MYCKACGKEIPVNSKFCSFCGESVVVVTPSNIPLKSFNQKIFSDNIVLCDDDIYRWTYRMNVWKNPTILITLWKVFFIGGMFPVLLVTILELVESGFSDAVNVFVPMFTGMLIIITAFDIIAFPIIIFMTGGSYQVVFELNDKGINHIQMDEHLKKNQVISMITILVGTAAGSPGTTGAGLLASSKQNSYSDFAKVTKIVAKPSRHVIYVNETLEHNQVYVDKEDFEQVKTYIEQHCKKAKRS